jgi:Mg-chelatase subunit ChlD
MSSRFTIARRTLLAMGVLLAVGDRLDSHEIELGGLKPNLDLPLDAAGDLGEVEDPTDVVVFLGQVLIGDGFVYAVDRSGSMQDSGELGRAKAEIARNIAEFSESTRFGVVFFDARIVRYPTRGPLVEASAERKNAALAWIDSVAGGGGSCMFEGLRSALDMANRSPAKRRVIVYVGDGGGTCRGANEREYLERTVVEITRQNVQDLEIDCVGVRMSDRRRMHEGFLRRLAAANGGTYRRID